MKQFSEELRKIEQEKLKIYKKSKNTKKENSFHPHEHHVSFSVTEEVKKNIKSFSFHFILLPPLKTKQL